VLLFNTRKDVVQNQFGTTVEHRLSASDSLRFAAYGGSRQVEQFLAIIASAQAPVTSSGAVVNLDRFYTGWTCAGRGDAACRPALSFTVEAITTIRKSGAGATSTTTVSQGH